MTFLFCKISQSSSNYPKKVELNPTVVNFQDFLKRYLRDSFLLICGQIYWRKFYYESFISNYFKNSFQFHKENYQEIHWKKFKFLKKIIKTYLSHNKLPRTYSLKKVHSRDPDTRVTRSILASIFLWIQTVLFSFSKKSQLKEKTLKS